MPGKLLRIVEIAGQDVEACGGTHLKNTAEADRVKIIKATKISDGIVRITFTAGKAAMQEEKMEKEVLQECAKLLNCEIQQLPARVTELFEKWKNVVKKGKKMEKKLTATEPFVGSEADILVKVCEILKTQPEHLVKTITRFREELEGA